MADFINRHCGDEKLFKPKQGQSALEYAGLNDLKEVSKSLSGVQRNEYLKLK